ncbi:MAG: hypothetical protein LUF80_04865 [Oscillospiraceae bacterium]|nr:hypothetical protein [Oscillospiraceae bacterium]
MKNNVKTAKLVFLGLFALALIVFLFCLQLFSPGSDKTRYQEVSEPLAYQTSDIKINPVNQSLSDANGSQTVPFSCDSPYYCISVSNTGSSAYNITLIDESGENQLKDSPVVLSSGKSIVITNGNAASGMRYLTVTAQDGSALSGTVSVQSASSTDE